MECGTVARRLFWLFDSAFVHRLINISYNHSVSIILTTLHLITMFSELWSNNEAYPEIFGSVRSFLSSIGATSPFEHNVVLKVSLNEVVAKLNSGIDKVNGVRVPLRFKTRKPVAISTFMPKFEEKYVWMWLAMRYIRMFS